METNNQWIPKVMIIEWQVKYRFIGGSQLGRWKRKNFCNIHEAIQFATQQLFEGDEVRIFDRSMKGGK